MEMWSQVALQMGMPWRAAEAMHWQLGENDISCRATGCMQLGIHDSTESPAMGSFVKPLSCKSEEFAGSKSPNLSLPSFKEAFSDLPDDQWRSQHPLLRANSIGKPDYPNCPQRREPNLSSRFDCVK
jgi:hypothetical protein